MTTLISPGMRACLQVKLTFTIATERASFAELMIY
ncbi:hypothetical protein GGD66_006465 [Bradyrhizobium sp. CIR48]|nr:hypothetical protein [Bradyrhizobium sp. CIR48]